MDSDTKIKTLLVHRSPGQSKELSAALTRLNCDVDIALGARAAIKRIESDPDIDIAFIDLQLPQDQGLEILKAVKTNRRLQYVPIVMTCEDCSADAVNSCKELSSTGILKLPTTDSVLKEKLDLALLSGKPVVLVVDDEEVIRDILASLLRLERFRAITAANGQQALELLGQEPVDAVVSDILMPGMTGLDLLVDIKEHHHHIPVILITGHSGKYKPADLIAAGADGYFTKPFKNTELVSTLRRVLAEYRKNHQREMNLPSETKQPVRS